MRLKRLLKGHWAERLLSVLRHELQKNKAAKKMTDPVTKQKYRILQT